MNENEPRKRSLLSIFILSGFALFGGFLLLGGIEGEYFDSSPMKLTGLNQAMMITGGMFLALGILPLLATFVLARTARRK